MKALIAMSGGVDSSVAAVFMKEKGYDPIIYRLFCLSSHYRKTLVFSYEIMDTIKNTYDKLKRKIALINNNQGDVNNKNIEL